jgi:putative transposase
MSRAPRPVIPEVPLHITQRGNNRLNCFFAETDYLVYLSLLRAAAHEASCAVHAYVLMTNHVHLLVSPKDERGPSLMMKALGERYVQYINRRYLRTGTLWEGRYRSCLVQTELYLMVCQRYIELNPVRAQLVHNPARYAWSSFLCNAHGKENLLVKPHELYFRLGHDPRSREQAYRDLFLDALTDDMLVQVRHATHHTRVLGTQQFKDEANKFLSRQEPPVVQIDAAIQNGR